MDMRFVVCVLLAAMAASAQVQDPVPTRKVEPLVPWSSPRIIGSVRLEAVISRDGNVRSLAVVRGHPLLVPAARRAAWPWRFEPARYQGKPIAALTWIDIPFRPAAQAPMGAVPAPEPKVTGPPPSRVQVSAALMQERLVHRVAPEMTPLAMDVDWHGALRLAAIVGKDGGIHQLEWISGAPIVRREVTEAVRQWKYRPVVIEGTPVEAITEIAVQRSEFNHGCDFRASRPIRLSVLERPDALLKQVRPEYPEQAKRRGDTGRVTVQLLVDPEGKVVQACGTGPGSLLHAAESAALQWEYRPLELNGRPVFFTLSVEFDFSPGGRVSRQEVHGNAEEAGKRNGG